MHPLLTSCFRYICKVLRDFIADWLSILFVQLEVPKELISSSQLQELRQERLPSFITCSPETNVTKVYDKETGITRCRLSNGIAVNYKVSLAYVSVVIGSFDMYFELCFFVFSRSCTFFFLLLNKIFSAHNCIRRLKYRNM